MADWSYHGYKWNSPWCMVVDGDEIDHEHCAAHEHGKDQCTDGHLLDPGPSALLRVQTSPKVAIDGRGGSVHEDGHA